MTRRCSSGISRSAEARATWSGLSPGGSSGGPCRRWAASRLLPFRQVLTQIRYATRMRTAPSGSPVLADRCPALPRCAYASVYRVLGLSCPPCHGEHLPEDAPGGSRRRRRRNRRFPHLCSLARVAAVCRCVLHAGAVHRVPRVPPIFGATRAEGVPGVAADTAYRRCTAPLVPVTCASGRRLRYPRPAARRTVAGHGRAAAARRARSTGPPDPRPAPAGPRSLRPRSGCPCRPRPRAPPRSRT